MIWITSDVDGELYREPFSKGILSRSLNIADIGFQRAHEIATDIELDLIKNGVTEIASYELAKVILNHLKTVDPVIAKKYENWRSLRNSKKPLIIFLFAEKIVPLHPHFSKNINH